MVSVYHALNRANSRSRLFRETAHYEDFLGIVEESLNFVPMRILAYCLMPNHWHHLYDDRPANVSSTRVSQRSK